jgi:hypothetical protein
MIIMIISPISPKQFDENELFTLIISITVVAVLWYLHKRNRALSNAELLSVYLFNLFLCTTLEAILAEHPLDLYDTMDYPHAEIFDVILQTFTYPATISIAIHIYAKYRPITLWYILGWGGILTFLEWVSLNFNLFQHKEWTLFYSCIFYSVVMIMNTFFFTKVRKHLNKNQFR